MKKALVVFLILAVAWGVFADPIGLKVYIDGFGFGNVAAKDYKFSGVGGQASITPGVEFAKSFGAFSLTTSVQDKFAFKDPLEQDLRWLVKGAYALQLAEASKLTFSAYNRLYLYGRKEKFADTDDDGIIDRIGPAVRFDQTLGFGTFYVVVEVDLGIHTKKNSELQISSGEGDNFKVGVTTNFGLSGYLMPKLAFRDVAGNTPTDVLTEFNIRVAYDINSNMGVYLNTAIATVKDGFKGANNGLTLEGRFTYKNIIPGLNAWATANVGKIAVEKADISFTPSLGVSYAF
jgi:hypothetical protein